MIHLVKVNFKSLYSLSKKAFSYLSISSVFWMVFYQVRPWSPTLQRTGGVTYPETDISLNVVSKEKNPNIMNQRNPRIKKNDFKMFFFFLISLKIVWQHICITTAKSLYVNTYVLKFVTGKCKKPQDVVKTPNWSDYVLEEGMVFSNGKLFIFANESKQAPIRMLQYKSAMT